MTDTIIRPVVEADTAALTALWASAFTPALEPDQWLIDEDRFAHTLVAVDAEGLCGSIYGLPKQLRESDGVVALVHCIGSVAVDERARGRGLARRLVAATLDSAGGADWALLFTGTPEVYRSSGFETFEMRRALTGDWRTPAAASAEPVAKGEGFVTMPPALRGLYERSRTPLTLAPVRNDRDWNMAAVRLADATLYTWPAEDEPEGYALTQVVEHGGFVTGVLAEVAVEPTCESARVESIWAGLLAAIAQDWSEAGVTRIDLAVPESEDPAQLAALAAFAPNAERPADLTGMTRPLRRAAQLHGIRHFTAADYF